MRALRIIGQGLIAIFCLLGGALNVATTARAEGPAFKVDPFWPKPLPNQWIMGAVGGLYVDKQDQYLGAAAPAHAR